MVVMKIGKYRCLLVRLHRKQVLSDVIAYCAFYLPELLNVYAKLCNYLPRIEELEGLKEIECAKVILL